MSTERQRAAIAAHEDYFGNDPEVQAIRDELLASHGAVPGQPAGNLPGQPPRGRVGQKAEDVPPKTPSELHSDEVLQKILSGDKAGAEAMRYRQGESNIAGFGKAVGE